MGAQRHAEGKVGPAEVSAIARKLDELLGRLGIQHPLFE